jgi:hypothetical protein
VEGADTDPITRFTLKRIKVLSASGVLARYEFSDKENLKNRQSVADSLNTRLTMAFRGPLVRFVPEAPADGKMALEIQAEFGYRDGFYQSVNYGDDKLFGGNTATVSVYPKVECRWTMLVRDRSGHEVARWSALVSELPKDFTLSGSSDRTYYHYAIEYFTARQVDRLLEQLGFSPAK